MKFSEILNETIDNLFQQDPKREQYVQQVFDILQSSYAGQGGLLGGGTSSVQELMKIPFWKIYREDDKVKVVILYKDKGGRKAVAGGCDGSIKAKMAFMRMLKDEFLQHRSYAEISGPMRKIMFKLLGEKDFLEQIIPWEQVKEILATEYKNGDIRDVDGVEYQRNLGGEWITKIMIGSIKPFY